MNKRPLLCLVTPALADANNGNWQTARRWARLLSGHYRVRLATDWSGRSAQEQADDGLLALHARRSADAVACWAEQRPGQPLALVLTGTDLYRDIASDAAAQRSLALAQRLIVLQDQGPLALPLGLRERCRVVLQSSTRRQTLPKTTAHLRAIAVGHLRDEKSPETLFAAARLLQANEGILIDHIGRALDPALGQAAQETMAACPQYRWLAGSLAWSTLPRASAFSAPMCWCTRAVWRAVPTSSWKRRSAAHRCWPRALTAMSACWAPTTKAILSPAMPKR